MRCQFLARLRYSVGMSRHQTPKTRSPLRLLLGVLCIGLVLLGLALSTTHTHAQGSALHADCSLCVVAHSGVQISAVAAQLPVTQVFATVDFVFPSDAPAKELPRSALFTRPPPADAHLS
jgi:hypothetical protein